MITRLFWHFIGRKTGFATQIKDNRSYISIEKLDSIQRIHNGLVEDEIIEIDVKK